MSSQRAEKFETTFVMRSGTVNSGSKRNEYPTQISYEANVSSNEQTWMPPPPLSPAPLAMTAIASGGISSPRHNGSNQFADGLTTGYPPPMHAYQLSSSPVILTTHQPPGGITYSKDTLGHRRINSYDGRPVSYGSTDASVSPSIAPVWGNSGVPQLPRHSGSNNTNNLGADGDKGLKRSKSEIFSAVSEIRKLTGSIRLQPSPQGRGGMPRGYFRGQGEDLQGHKSPIQSQMYPIKPGVDTSPLLQQQHQNYSYQQRQQHQHQQQHQQQQPIVYNRGVYMGGDGNNDISPSPFTGSVRNINSPSTLIGAGSVRSLKDMNYNDDGSDAGGEAVFLLNKKSTHNQPSRTSRRESRTQKKHMRQRSAQLFMENVKGTEQLPSCRDILFLLLFVFHLLGIIYLGRTYGNEALRIHDESSEDNESSVTINFTNMIYIAALSGLFAIVISGFTLLLMTNVANKIVQIALVLSITFSFAWGTIGIGLSPKKIVPVTGIIALAMSVAYAFIVWDRIPFAAANLNAGLTGILANPGAVFVSFIFQLLALGWSIYYVFVAFGVYDAIQEGEIKESFQGIGWLYYSLLGISYYWTLNVFLNIVQVTVADVIGKWWFAPDGDTSHRIADLKHAFFRSFFYSIGSICFGSLFVGPVRILRQLSVFFRPSDEVSSLMTLHECMHCVQSCMTSCVEKLGARFSPWSFTYVGLYGYSLMAGGLHSAELFDKRGWTTIVSDDLVPNVLLLITLAIAGLTGLFAYLLEQFESLSLTSTGQSLITSFVVGGLVGLVVSSVLFGIISSSVNAVIVLFAASPVDFEQNHPKLSEEMRNAWREVWPGCMDVLNMRVQVAGFLDPTLNGSMRGSVRGADLYFNPAMNGSTRSLRG
mmetsp:Transcript_30409/g.34918  ORF Transcript_30409/g.34918 Transcript_30409/m.34918 type:complete len:873 (-) Transcript_30409:54-2672(-)